MPKRRVVSRPNLLMLVIIWTGYLSISIFLVLLVQKPCDNVETKIMENFSTLERKKILISVNFSESWHYYYDYFLKLEELH